MLAGHTDRTLDESLEAVRPGSLTVVIMMGLAGRQEIAARLVAHGWSPETPAAVICGASTAEMWTWRGRTADLGAAEPPPGLAGVIVVGEVVPIGDGLAISAATAETELSVETRKGRNAKLGPAR